MWVFSSIDCGHVTLLALLKVGMPFKMVDHNIKSTHLKHQMKCSFLDEWMLIIAMESDWVAILFDVPQDSVLGSYTFFTQQI